MPAIDISQFEADTEDVTNKARSANTKLEKADADYEAAIEAIKRSNTSRQDAIDALGDLERSLGKARDTTDALLGQEGNVPPVIPEPDPQQPMAPIRGMRRK